MDKKGWNYVDQRYNITAASAVSRRFLFSITGGYSVETDPDRSFESGDADFGTDDGYVIKRHKDKRKLISINFFYSLSRRSSLRFMLGFSEFDTSVTDGSDFYNFISTYSCSLTRKTGLSVDLSYTRFEFSWKPEAEGDLGYLEDIVAGRDMFELTRGSDYEMDTYIISCGLNHHFSDDLRLDFKIGWRYVETEQTEQKMDEYTGKIFYGSNKKHGDGITFNFDLEKNFSYSSINLQITQKVGTNPSSGASYENRKFSLKLSPRFTERFRATVWFSYYTRETDPDDEFAYEVDRESYSIRPNISYQFGERLTIRLGYNYLRQENNIRNSESERNSFYLSMTYNFLRPYIIR